VTWLAWTLLWVVLVAGAGTVVFLLLRARWRQLKALGREMGEVTTRLEAVADRLAESGKTAEGP
jgi:hypothetical protein